MDAKIIDEVQNDNAEEPGRYDGKDSVDADCSGLQLLCIYHRTIGAQLASYYDCTKMIISYCISSRMNTITSLH